MIFPRAQMSVKELSKMGFSVTWLRALYNEEGYPLATQMSKAPNSKIMFNTEELNKYLKRTANMSRK